MNDESRTRNALVVVCAKLWYNKIPMKRGTNAQKARIAGGERDDR